MDHPVYILSILAINIALSIWLEKNTILKPLGAALLSIVVTAITANIGIIPSSEDSVPVYDGIFTYVAPISIFYLLLGVNLKALKKAGKPMIILFLLGALGTSMGVVIANTLLGMGLGENAGAIGGMIAGTYIGGSVNFNAVALHYHMLQEGPIYASIVAVDNIYTTLWMVFTLAVPAFFNKFFPRSKSENSDSTNAGQYDESNMDMYRLAILVVLGFASFWVSEIITGWFSNIGLNIPSILILTTLALLLAQFKQVQRLKEANILGLYLVYLFLAVIGAYCNLGALGGVGEIVFTILGYLLIVILVHGALVLIGGGLLKYDWEMVAIASQANIGGSSSALALAKSMKRDDLLLAAVLIGSLGNGIGTYLGFLIAGLL